jgi:O-antigen/teichoic acid export membrane protein
MTVPGGTRGGGLSVQEAIRAGQRMVNLPVALIMLAGGVCGYIFLRHSLWIFAVLFGGIALAWMWWAFAVRRWWRWAIEHGADPNELQDEAEDVKLIWPRGSFLYRRGGVFGRHDHDPVLPRRERPSN